MHAAQQLVNKVATEVISSKCQTPLSKDGAKKRMTPLTKQTRSKQMKASDNQHDESEKERGV